MAPRIKTKRVEASPTGVNRDTTEGKCNVGLIYDGPMLLRWAWLLTRGVETRGKRNWLNASSPEDLERFQESSDRHYTQWRYGEEDEDHAAAVFFNMNGVEYTKARLLG